jgi:hypothetical protein
VFTLCEAFFIVARVDQMHGWKESDEVCEFFNPWNGWHHADWDEAFVTDRLSKKQFKEQYKGKADTDFDSGDWSQAGEAWRTEDDVMVAEWWSREKVDKPIVMLSNGMVMGKEEFEANADLTGAHAIEP